MLETEFELAKQGARIRARAQDWVLQSELELDAGLGARIRARARPRTRCYNQS